MSAMAAIATEAYAAEFSARQDPASAESELLKLVDDFVEPTNLLERGLAAAVTIREGLNARYPRKAAVLGTNRLGLLATLLLRLRSIEVVTLGDALQPLLTPRRLQGLRGWRHVKMSPGLAHIQLVEEIGARYERARELGLEEAKHAFGPFDVIVMASEESLSVLRATKTLGKKGVLIDATCSHDTLEVWVAHTTACFLLRHQVALKISGSIHVPDERAISDLASADLQYPGWLARTAYALNANVPGPEPS